MLCLEGLSKRLSWHPLSVHSQLSQYLCVDRASCMLGADIVHFPAR